MKLVMAFFKLIRSMNLFFIVITQCLFYYAILVPTYHHYDRPIGLQPNLFYLLVFASVLIAAGGYIINDYFDINIDRINKPDKLVVDKIIRRRWAIIWHWLMSTAGILISFFVGWKLSHTIFLGLFNIGCVVLLWFYSTTFKKKLLSGNIIISILTAWVVFVLYAAEFGYSVTYGGLESIDALAKVFKLAVVYAGFAFIISLIREVVKDIEDMAGDSKYGCKTMPVVWGVRVSKVFIATWLIVLMASITILQLYVIRFGWWLSISYAAILIIAPLLLIFLKLSKAKSTQDFHQLSNWIKAVMMTGILSMFFFWFYA
ncbi:MAG: geranylgeranylglycerol-phosphate geranylgeranyltransferase [Chitinophagaceae bacterium]|uniref:geranylgeranylglycerol-phosphate geranylgeranyltransferase n=1 Tax=unclassified Paraflavitalea TaxID=2798305 RepID=UPI003D34DDCE|nr:geranylgeranylglycerol-phosphate geranylgeranyltransferase [Chitinophagaceae bacterium]